MADRVLWLTKGLGLGGVERLLTLMAAKVDGERFQVDVAYLLPWKDAFVPELADHGVDVVCLGARRTTDPLWIARLRSLFRERQYVLTHTHSPVPAIAARLLARSPMQLVHTEHNVWERYRWPTYAANAATYARNDAVFAVSDGVADSVVRPWWAPGCYPAVETLLHGVDPEAAPRGAEARLAARTQLQLDPSVPVVGTVANLTPKKDHAGLITAIDVVRERVTDVVLLIIGSGPLEADLRAQVADRGLDEHVRFLGARHDVPALLPALDVFVLGSRFEGLPISLLEAMAAEIACVVTRVGGIPEVVSDGIDGRLVPPGEPGALAGALSEMLLDNDLRSHLGAAGRQRVHGGFSIERAVRRMEELYGQLLASGAGSP